MNNFKKCELKETVSATGGNSCNYYRGVWNYYYVAWFYNPIPANKRLMDNAYRAYVNCVNGN